VSLLCVHHCFEGATVGPAGFTFRRGPDVIRCRDVPAGVTAVLTGHVHRHQVLTADLDGRPLPAPILYPGSTERTAFAEKDEPKGTVLVEVDAGAPGRAAELRWRFRELPARPMVVTRVSAHGVGPAELRARVREAVDRAPPDAVLRLLVQGKIPDPARTELAAPTLRALAPATMNVDVVLADEPRRPRRADPRQERQLGPRVPQGWA
jgi:DNA repair exonuclease SbcCD nuclease subunit